MLAILLLYDGKNIHEVAEIIRRSERRVKEWLKRWNRKCYEGIMPETRKRGRKPKNQRSPVKNRIRFSRR